MLRSDGFNDWCFVFERQTQSRAEDDVLSLVDDGYKRKDAEIERW